MFGFLAVMTGAIVTIMSSINSIFSSLLGQFESLIIVHSVGLVLISIISLVLLLLKNQLGIKKFITNKTSEKIPFWFYLGGVVGVGTVFTSNYAFSVLDASLAVASALLGQTVFSIFSDSFGFLGHTKYPLKLIRLPGIAIAIIGVVIMAGKIKIGSFSAIAMAFLAGICSGLSSIINAELGNRRNILFSTRTNYITGLSTVIILAIITKADFVSATQTIGSIKAIYIFGGGALGICTVSALNIFIPKMTVFSATILMYSGQTIMGVIMDAVKSGHVDIYKILGTIVLLTGLALDSKISKK